MVAVTALMSAIAIYTVMSLALSQARQAQFYQERLVARNASEAGIVWAQQRLWEDPTYCGAPDPPAALFNPPTTVNVSVTNCGAGNAHTISAKVTY